VSLGAEKRGIMTTGRYDSSESSHIGTAITFLLIGLGAGALAGLLLAPKSGKQLRKDLRRGYEDAKDSVGEWADEAKDRVRDVGERVRDAASRGADLAEDLREKVEPLRRAINRS
jgi:gas vesicle protein